MSSKGHKPKVGDCEERKCRSCHRKMLTSDGGGGREVMPADGRPQSWCPRGPAVSPVRSHVFRALRARRRIPADPHALVPWFPLGFAVIGDSRRRGAGPSRAARCRPGESGAGGAGFGAADSDVCSPCGSCRALPRPWGGSPRLLACSESPSPTGPLNSVYTSVHPFIKPSSGSSLFPP